MPVTPLQAVLRLRMQLPSRLCACVLVTSTTAASTTTPLLFYWPAHHPCTVRTSSVIVAYARACGKQQHMLGSWHSACLCFSSACSTLQHSTTQQHSSRGQ